MDIKQLNDEGRELWNQKARFWDELHGEYGNVFHRKLVEPSVLRLLDLRAGESVLDAGCGNGVIARRLARAGAVVTAFDYSAAMLALARARDSAVGVRVDYHLIDATDEAALLRLGLQRFDAITCSMALMDMPAIGPLFAAASQLLKPAGRFVFATMHPAFNSNNPVFLHEKEDRDGLVSEHFSVKLRHYLDMPPVKGSGAPGEPTPHYYCHRPLGELLGTAFAAGFVLDALLEPAYEAEAKGSSSNLGWSRFRQFPPILSGRLRLNYKEGLPALSTADS